MLNEISVCRFCGSPIFETAGNLVHSCGCGKTAQAPKPNTNNIHVVENSAYNLLKEIIAQECLDIEGDLSSHGKYIFANALKLMNIKGDIEILEQRGPVVRARWK